MDIIEDPLLYSARSKSLNGCAYWCSRAIASFITKKESKYIAIQPKIQADLKILIAKYSGGND
jgi:hypothetical protein